MSNFINNKLKPLVSGSTIAVVAPASSVDSKALSRGVKEIESRGYKTHLPLPICKGEEEEGCKFGSAKAETRAKALMEMIADPEIAAVFSARGGYGSAHILPLLDFEKIAAARKPVVGYSDITVLLQSILSKSKIPTIHGPTVATEFSKTAESSDAKKSVDSLFALLTGEDCAGKIQVDALQEEKAIQGELIVGNLSMLQTLVGTRWEPNLFGSILCLEDISEPAYRAHRTLHHLKSSGKLDSLKAIVLGRFSEGHAIGASQEELKDVLSDLFLKEGLPCFLSDDFGHLGLNIALPLGCLAEIKNGLLSLLESPLEKA